MRLEKCSIKKIYIYLCIDLKASERVIRIVRKCTKRERENVKDVRILLQKYYRKVKIIEMEIRRRKANGRGNCLNVCGLLSECKESDFFFALDA